jgi:HSP20 family molecular chaperone IbpA
MDLIDDPTESTLTAVFEIPGIKTSDISLHILDGHLVVLGERRPIYNTTRQTEASSQDTENSAQAPKLNIPVQELRYGTFRRAILIPEGIKVSLLLSSLLFMTRLT